jgi:L-fuculose-phosphate aldolase
VNRPRSQDGSATDPRAELIGVARAMADAGLNRVTSGNVSARASGGDFWITPTGMDYGRLTPDDIPLVRADGGHEGRRLPSSEWRIHRDVYAARPDVGAIVHAHSPHAVSIACTRRDIPPFHYMIARFGGDTVRCSGYATFGTQELSDAVLTALQGRTACLLANHGMVVCGPNLPRALAAAIELEELCGQYWRACLLGDPVLLSAAEMADVRDRFAGYGRQSGPEPADRHR